MKILLTGGTGLVGRALTEKLLDRNDNVTILSRQEHKNQKGLTFVTRLTDNTYFDAIVNLAGEPIFGLFNKNNAFAIPALNLPDI